MKYYNPFKPHIVMSTSGLFAIRELGILGWYYWDAVDFKFKWNWFEPVCIKKWCMFKNVEDAKEFLYKYKKMNEPLKFVFVIE